MEAAIGLLASTCMQQADEVADNHARDHAVCYGVGEPTNAAAGWEEAALVSWVLGVCQSVMVGAHARMRLVCRGDLHSSVFARMCAF